MNLQPLKLLVPGRVMLVMLLLLGLLLGWYYVSSTAQETHLVRRNFNHLNQITSNIDASVTSLQAQVRFSQGMVCSKATTDESCLEQFKQRLAGNSPLVRDEAAIRAKVVGSGLVQELAQATGKLPADGGCARYKDLERKAKERGTRLINGGIGTSFRVELVRPIATDSATAASQCLNRYLDLALEIDLFFDQVQGLARSEGYFDSIIIARSGKNGPDAGDQVGPTQRNSAIVYNTASDEPYARADKLQSIFRMQSGFERYSSISDLEQQHGVDRYRATLLPGEKSGKNPTEIPPQPFTHSTVVPFEAGGFSHLAFVQPVKLGADDQELLIIGVVSQRDFNALKYRVPLNYLSILLVAFVLVLLSLNFIRLALIGKRGVLLQRDLHLSYISLVTMASLITILIGNIGASMQMQSMFDEDQQAIFDRVRTEFELELMQKLALMKPSIDASAFGASYCKNDADSRTINGRTKVFCGGAPVPMISALFSLDENGDQVGEYRTHLKSSPTPPFNVSRRDYFKAVQSGDTWLLDSRRLGGWLGNKEYGELFSALDGQRFFMQRIESYTDSTLETAVSIPVDDEPGVDVRVAVARFRSLEDVVMPAGFGLAVFESRSGRVLFHDEYHRSLRENFYRATDDNADLKAAVIARVKMGLDLDYKGEDVHAVVGPLADTPWTLVIYYRKSLIDTINFHFGVTASILSAVFIILFLLGSSVIALLVPRLIQAWRGDEEPVTIVPDWIFPMDGKAAAYIDLTGMNLALLLLYTGITYHLDIVDSWPWLLAAPAVIFGLWHGRLRPGLYRSFPGVLGRLAPAVPYIFAVLVVFHYVSLLLEHDGATYLGVSAVVSVVLYVLLRYNEARERRALETKTLPLQIAGRKARDLINYRRASSVFVLMLSVSPTILLYNENFDVHEKLWVEYTNWFNSEELRDRSAGYQRYAERTNDYDDLGGFLLGMWQGVYLPRTVIYGFGSAKQPSETDERADQERTLEPLVDRWPALRNKYRLPVEFDKEFTLYMLATRLDARSLDTCHDHITLDGNAAHRCEAPPPVDDQVALLKYLVKALPSFSATGLILESFTERSREMHALQLEPPGAPAQGEGAAASPVDAAIQPALVAFDEFDSTSGLHYLTSTVFPHTRSEFPQVILIPYLIFLAISGVFAYLLTGFLADRQLGGRFARRKAAIDREANHDEILAGGLMVVPAGMSLEQGYRQLLAAQPLRNQAFAAPEAGGSGGLHHVEVSDQMVLLKDFVGIIENRGLAARVMSFLEEQLVQGKHVIVLSDIDPKYWLRSRHIGDSLPLQVFHRWEALVMSLHSYCLFPPGRECAVPDPGCFRRIWERSSKDEKLLLAGLQYENVVNYRNLSAGISLYRRGIVSFKNFQYQFTNTAFARFVERQLPRDQFRREAAGYENKVWLAFRGPILLGLLVTLAFIAYTAQDEMRIAFSILTTVSGTLVAVGALSDRLRDFRSYLGN